MSSQLAISDPSPTLPPQAPMGLTYYSDGSASFRVWAPHAASVHLLISDSLTGPTGATPNPDPEALGYDIALNAPTSANGEAAEEPTGKLVALGRSGDIWGMAFQSSDDMPPGAAYQVVLDTGYGNKLLRRDPFARHTDYASNWCYAVDQGVFEWKTREWKPLSYDYYIIYEMHVSVVVILT